MVFAYKYIPADPGKYYLYSPDSEEAQNFAIRTESGGYEPGGNEVMRILPHRRSWRL